MKGILLWWWSSFFCGVRHTTYAEIAALRQLAENLARLEELQDYSESARAEAADGISPNGFVSLLPGEEEQAAAADGGGGGDDGGGGGGGGGPLPPSTTGAPIRHDLAMLSMLQANSAGDSTGAVLSSASAEGVTGAAGNEAMANFPPIREPPPGGPTVPQPDGASAEAEQQQEGGLPPLNMAPAPAREDFLNWRGVS